MMQMVNMASRVGYGSHTFLNEYIRKNKCRKIMEIGVADGENAKTMMTAATGNFSPAEVEYYGFDIFEGDRIAQVRQKLAETGCRFALFKGDTVITLPKHVKILQSMDLIFIDGGHSYETVRSDWTQSKRLMHSETAVFFHNYDYSGVKRLVDGICREEYLVEVIHPSSDYDTALVKRKT